MERWKAWARRLKKLIQALAIAYGDPRTPWHARVVAACVVGYALSPIDLIPDPIPVLGYLDDLILLPLGVALAVRLIPPDVWRDARAQAEAAPWSGRPTNRVAAAVIVVFWIAAFVGCWFLLRK